MCIFFHHPSSPRPHRCQTLRNWWTVLETFAIPWFLRRNRPRTCHDCFLWSFIPIHLHAFYKARLRWNKTGRIKRSITVANHPGNPLQSGNPNRAYEDLTSSYHRLLNHLKAHKSNQSTHANPLTLWGGHGDAIDLIMQKARSPNLFESRCRY